MERVAELTEVPGHGYGSLTELTEVAGTGMEVLRNSHMFWVGRYTNVVPVPRLFCGTGVQNLRNFRVRVLMYRTREVPGTGVNVVQNLQIFRYG